MPLLPNINVGSAPNDGTGDTIRNAFIKVNENFQFIEAFFPNTDVANLTANITSSGTSTFNIINGGTIGNAGTAFLGATVSAATIGNSGATLTGSAVNVTSVIASTVSAATIGNSGTSLTGTLTTANQASINSIGSSVTSNVSVVGNLILNSTSISLVKSLQYQTLTAPSANGTYNLIFNLTNVSQVAFHMSSNVAFTLVGTPESGIRKDYIFFNNTGSTRIVTLINSNNNKGNANIAVANGTVATISMISTDTTSANIFAMVANT
jgi:hypothetical protein